VSSAVSITAPERRIDRMTVSRATRLVWLAALAVGGLAGAAAAQQPTQAQASAIRQSCRSDYQAHCAGVPTGGQAALSCLQQHVTDLSPACQSAVGATTGASAAPGAPGPAAPPHALGQAAPPPSGGAGNKRQEAAMLRRACGEDYRAYCRGVPLGGGAAIGCLSQNASRLSPQCQGALAHVHGG
jgi:hypothetical protein